MTKIAIVGATGPTGIHLVAELCRHTAAVRVIARDMDKLARLFPDAAVEKHPADILDADATLRAIEGCDLVYDCVGLPGDQMHLHPVTGLLQVAPDYMKPVNYDTRKLLRLLGPQRMTSYADGIGQTLTWISSSR
jgi:putative NADH-flavin reductase